MNQWGNDQFMMMPQMMGQNMGLGPNMGPGPNVGPPNMGPPALLPTPMQPPMVGPDGMTMPLAPPTFMMNEWNQSGGPDGPNPGNFIGPKKPDEGKDDKNQDRSSRDRDQRDGRRDNDRERDRGRRPRSPYNRRDNRDRNERSRSDRREKRPQRWGDKDPDPVDHNNMPQMMPGNNMMQYGNNMMMGQQQMDMGNMMSMGNMMPGMAMMPNMMQGMMPNMGMDSSNMMMMQTNMTNQPIVISKGMLMPPLPNSAATMPPRRERPPGCRTIFVGGLPQGINEGVIREIFERFGIVTDVKLYKQGVCHVRFGSQKLVEQSFMLSGCRFKTHEQSENEATTMFIDYAMNRDDQNEYERSERRRSPSPPRIEPYTPATFTAISEKIKSDTEFVEAAPTLAGWLERGECNKKNANAFYALIQASNNQVRRLYAEKMAVDEEFQTLKSGMKDRFASVITQFEQVGKILMAAKIQRVSDHFSKQQRKNIEMWLKMTEDVENIKEEFNSMFDEDDGDDKNGKGGAIYKKYEELKTENDNLQHELEGYRNEAYLAKDEAERKFEKFKAHYIAQQALQSNISGHHQKVFPPLPPPPPLPLDPPPPGGKTAPVLPSEAKLISVLTAFLLVHPLGVTLENLVAYVRSIIPTTTQPTVHNILQKYPDVFSRQAGYGNSDGKWTFVTFDNIKSSLHKVV